MEIKLPNLPNWAWVAIAAATVYGLNRGVSDAARGARRAVNHVANEVGDVIEGVAEIADDATETVKRKWRGAGEGTRAAMPIVAAGAALIIWAKGR